MPRTAPLTNTSPLKKKKDVRKTTNAPEEKRPLGEVESSLEDERSAKRVKQVDLGITVEVEHAARVCYATTRCRSEGKRHAN